MKPTVFAEFVLRSLAVGGMAWAVLAIWPAKWRGRGREAVAICAVVLLLWPTAALVVPLPRLPLPAHAFPTFRDGALLLWRGVASVWLIGASLALAREAAGAWRLRALVRGSAPLNDPGWRAALLEARNALGEWREVDLRVTRAFGPAAAGVLRRTIILPGPSRDWSAGMKRMVLLHELAHFRRQDLAIQAIARLALAFQWFNPFAHALLRQIETERELGCDGAVSRLIANPGDYAACLLQLAGDRFPMEAPAPALTLLPRRMCLLERRVRCLLAPVQPSHHGSGVGEAMLVALSVSLLAACSLSGPASISADARWTSAEVERRLSADPFPAER
ncbi:MAG: bla regulator protein blaR1 [Chthoniobacter sp.]|jgi:beta-lactamase regulating signal transducer with metallopeptidase domain|nr:bla regulator protein blaR1 [Chthoniobacter sp.]